MADEKPTTFETRLQRRIRDRAQMSPSSPRRVQMVLASEVVERAIEWLWKNFLPKGYLALVSGDPGTGKSHVAEDLAARVTRGAQMPDGSTVEPGSVIFLTVEEGTADVLVPRLRVAGADLGRVCIITGTIQPDRPEVELLTNLKDDLSVIESALPEWEKETGLPCRLLVVDPIMNHLGGVNPNKEGDVRPLMAEIAAFLQRTGIAMLGIRHLNKDESKSLMYRGGGSMAFTGAARAEFLVGADREDPGRVVLDRIKGNLSRKPDPLAYRIAEANSSRQKSCCSHSSAKDRKSPRKIASQQARPTGSARTPCELPRRLSASAKTKKAFMVGGAGRSRRTRHDREPTLAYRCLHRSRFSPYR